MRRKRALEDWRSISSDKKRCENHRRPATVFASFGAEPGADLCDECFDKKIAEASPIGKAMR